MSEVIANENMDEFNVEASCSLCSVQYTSNSAQDSTQCVIPCTTGHIVCLRCFKEICSSPLIEETSPGACCIHGDCCRHEHPHFRCPMCQDIFHLPRDNVDAVIIVPRNSEEFQSLLENIEQLGEELVACCEEMNIAGKRFIEGMLQVDKDFKKKIRDVRISTVFSAVTGAVGTVLGVIGGALAIPSLSASVPLLIAGGVSASTAVGTGVTHVVASKGADKHLNNCMKNLGKKFHNCDVNFREKLHEFQLQDALLVLGFNRATSREDNQNSLLGAFREFLDKYKGIVETVKTFSKIGFPLKSSVKSIYSVSRYSLLIADASLDAAGAAATIFKGASKLSRIGHVAGLVLGPFLLALDLYTMIDTSLEIHNSTAEGISIKLGEMIKYTRSCMDNANLVADELKEFDIDH